MEPQRRNLQRQLQSTRQLYLNSPLPSSDLDRDFNQVRKVQYGSPTGESGKIYPSMRGRL
jgi:hypothetical protein